MRDKKLSPKLSIIIAGVLVVLTVLTAVVWNNQMRAESKATSQQDTAATQTDNQQAAKPSTVSYDGVEGKSALELLKSEATVITKDSAYGEYVDSINGVVGGTDGKYWAFYVNGQMAQVGAADYQTKAGDKIEWKFE